ncbi:hypothetical protein VNO77_13959 [Canavalia gladiata]|uniref:Uncharacterized protein n=1 Tax=Canavalia gladiata TaxID=3824 RepID=A0AAN9QRT8_CANGL
MGYFGQAHPTVIGDVASNVGSRQREPSVLDAFWSDIKFLPENLSLPLSLWGFHFNISREFRFLTPPPFVPKNDSIDTERGSFVPRRIDFAQSLS